MNTLFDIPMENPTPPEYIWWLANEFACLKPKIRHLKPSQDFIINIEKHSRGWSHGERVAVLFLCAVWSGKNWPGRKAFDMVDAASVLSLCDREVILMWMRYPYYP